MTSFTLLLIYTYGLVSVNVQSEDACVLAAKAITLRTAAAAICIDEFEGKIFFFERGKQLPNQEQAQ